MAKSSAAPKERLIHVPVAELRASLQVVAPFVATRAPTPVLTQLCFTEDTVRASLGHAGAIAYLTWRTPSPFTVPAERFTKLIESLHAQGVEKLTLHRGEATTTFRGGGTTVRFASMDAREFPAQTPPKLAQRTALTPEFWTAWGRVAFSGATDEAMPHFCGVYWDARRLVAADSHRTARATLHVPPPTAEGLLLPDYLMRRFVEHQGSVVDVGHDPAQGGLLWFTLEAAVIYGSLLAAEFPVAAADQVFAAAQGAYRAKRITPTICDVEPNEAALARLDLFVDAASPKVVVRLDGACMRVSAEQDHALEEVLPARVTGPPVEFALYLTYLRDALAHAHRFAYLPGRQVFFVGDRGQPPWEHLISPMVADAAD